MSKLDLLKIEKEYYKAKLTPQLVSLNPVKVISIKGKSAPEDPIFSDAISSLYGTAYPLKFEYKKRENDFVVPKLEGFWWVEGQVPFNETPRGQWCWKLCIPMPSFVEQQVFEEVLVKSKGKGKVASKFEVKFETLSEGESVQMLHLGPYENEEKSISKIMLFMEENSLAMNGHHHEIYLSDPMKTASEKLKTILRYPVKSKK